MSAQHSSSGRQPNFTALNRRRHLYLAGRPSRWALAHILVVDYARVISARIVLFSCQPDGTFHKYCIALRVSNESQSPTTRSCSTFACCCRTDATLDRCSAPRDSPRPTHRCLRRRRFRVTSAMPSTHRLWLRACRLAFWLPSTLCIPSL